MIVPNQKVNVKWNNRLKEYYTSLGYKELKQGEEFEINAEHALKSNPSKIKICCDKCGNIYELSIRQYYKNKQKHKQDMCKNCLLAPSHVKCICKTCGKEFEVIKSQKEKGGGKFCSKECYDKFQNQKVAVKCCKCGKVIYKKPSQLKKENFCSVLCANQYGALKRKQRVKKQCKYCGQEYEVKKYQENTSSFCSRECLNKWLSIHNSGENNSRYKKRILIKCDYCGKDFYEQQYKIDKSETHFCSKECKDEYHKNFIIRSDEFKNFMREIMLKNLTSGKIKTTKTKPHMILNKILEKLGIKYINEYGLEYYSFDSYLPDHDLFIEVMGTFWHCDNRFYEFIEHPQQLKTIRQDKSKSSFMKNLEHPVLYLWEYDLLNRLDVCEMLIKYYILNKGNIENYHSFNYENNNGQLVLRNEIIIPYMEYESEELNKIVKEKVKRKTSKIDMTKNIIFNCDYCGKEKMMNLKHYNRSKNHFCSVECANNFKRNKNNLNGDSYA